VEEDVSSVIPFPFFEDFLLEAFRGAAEQLATATTGTFTGRHGRRDRKDLSSQTSEHPIDSSLVLYRVFISFVFIHCGFTNHDIYLFLHLFYEVFDTVAISQLKTESGKGHFLSRLVYIEPPQF
jgi:hypothetical protein